MDVNLYSSTQPSTMYSVAHSASMFGFCPAEQGATLHVFQPLTKSPAFVAGEQLVGFAKGALRAASYFTSLLPFLVEKLLKLLSYIYSNLPSFTLPGALAIDTSECSPVAPELCPTPTGRYQKSCFGGEVIYLPVEDQCELTTSCGSFYKGLPPQPASIRYSPRTVISLENINCTLTIEGSREASLNADLSELAKTAPTKEALAEAQEAIIGNLKTGDVITIKNALPEIVAPAKWPKENEAFNAFQRIARRTGGIMGHSPSSESLNPLIAKMFAHILKSAGSSEFVDIAFVIDTTSSMEPDIVEVQKKLVQFLEELQTKKKEKTFRVALLEYRDKTDTFLNQVRTHFTSNLHQVQEAVRRLRTSGGGDKPEAVLDALLAAKDHLSWNPKASRIVILIGDAPPHPKTMHGLDESEVIAQYQATGTQISVYPIFSERAAAK